MFEPSVGAFLRAAVRICKPELAARGGTESAWTAAGAGFSLAFVNSVRLGTMLVLLAAGCAGWYFWQATRLERSQDGPIRAAARRYGVEPALVKAVVWRESRFNPAVRGRAGEIGLMQLMEVAAQEWADTERVPGFEHEHCFHPGTNTLAGTWYLAKLLRRYRQTDNPVPYALADYNAGRGNVIKWNKGAAATNSSEFVRQIDFPSTRDYVTQVMSRAGKYREEFR
jgi:soluble lytic murein transglycosylase